MKNEDVIRDNYEQTKLAQAETAEFTWSGKGCVSSSSFKQTLGELMDTQLSYFEQMERMINEELK